MVNTQEVNTQEQEIRRSLAASDMYQLLSMFFRLPTVEMATALLNGSLAEDVIAIYCELNFSIEEIQHIKTKFTTFQNDEKTKEELLTEIRQEYTRLFTNPKKPAMDIYETLFCFNPEKNEGSPSLFISPAALDAERCYKKAGLMMTKEVNEPGDHMSTEMEFMMYLYLEKARALQENNQEKLDRREAEIQEFSEVHLKKWAKQFFNHCITLSNSEVYRTLGEIGSAFMREMLVKNY
ncbi:MAG: molecular chaperone TorD family protein [Dehalobacter sp. 4CP]|uniref:TorD/DmsD family molecular chaperone n=1 Tax=unclassified Dehalobacter TaxID=2635733 RepID=UPI000E6BBDBD|nr:MULTISPECIES: molecular chaperone TorD family protein [unclassified Dehalobacter]MCM1566625.1 molecular chaperone TorD family protein [Dehalobacter sp.]NBJ16869.1 molecular chaperone TorD family protein [Dehalobacter sp. 4CP]RJE47149.1 dehydrogenase [Dehalobacter sp. MCB1]TCX53689.1 dehydrogenase [Dehalobacter sp. 14DCB1]TCX54992.1 dehydrogenase [Dehalobacter sp. 12DCB1]